MACGAGRADCDSMETKTENVISIPDGPAFDHEPNWMRRVRVLRRAEGGGRFIVCEDVDTGEKLTVHASKLPADALPRKTLKTLECFQPLAEKED